MADEKGRVLVVSCSSFLSSQDTIKQICGDNSLPTPSASPGNNLCAVPWMIENKYFTAHIEFCYSSNLSAPNDVIKGNNSDFEGMIIVYDHQKSSSRKDVMLWSVYLDSLEVNPSVCLLLNTGEGESSEPEVDQKEIVEWCLRNSFELVELKPDNDVDNSDGEFGEQTGFGRVVQALQCGEWPNIKLKSEQKKPAKNDANGLAVVSEEEKPEVSEPATESASQQEKKNGNCAMDASAVFPEEEMELLSRLGSEDPGDESFEELFTRLQHMKGRGSFLESNGRR
ncbi:alpha- and gamma-adaptin-binding protein p34 isoform X2 [Nematostella vectensis]|uniref:alpha- and gamma-adaptin-binding protein p34 isoform X2 n=1 Tax=Nematostella vectensis TaxID=45351 RepID=UPI00207780E7|nr:alpha- and gamma-adaptin-binding protein p34 isoform X2 [Nematostella vectensis]